MKILIAGLFQYETFEEVFSNALKDIGHDVHKLKFHKYFKSGLGKLEFHFNFNLFVVNKLNRDLINEVKSLNPNILLIWRGTFILPKTLLKIKKNNPEIQLVSYNNDDPFSSAYANSENRNQKSLWKNFIATIPFYDSNFVFRPANIADYNKSGSKKTFLLQPYFSEKSVRHLSIQTEFDYDVTFIGHAERHRIEIVNFLLDNDVKVKIFGSFPKEKLSKKYEYGDIFTVTGDDYYKVLNKSKLCLSFYSKLNRDEYTIRSFEIPAAHGCMVSERNDSMLSMFSENYEAIYFSDKYECLDKVRELLSDDDLRNTIARNGEKKVYMIGGGVTARASKFLKEVFD